jgi:hypothetical protein
VRLERLGKLKKKSNDLIGNRTRVLPARGIVPQPTTLPGNMFLRNVGRRYIPGSLGYPVSGPGVETRNSPIQEKCSLLGCVAVQISCDCRPQAPTHVDSSLADFSTLKMEEKRSSETSVHTGSTQRHIPDDGILHSHRCENLKSQIQVYTLGM